MQKIWKPIENKEKMETYIFLCIFYVLKQIETIWKYIEHIET